MSDVSNFVNFFFLLILYLYYSSNSTPKSPSKKTEPSKKSRAESRKLPGNLEISAFLCTFAHVR